jgi:hypothetical protein
MKKYEIVFCVSTEQNWTTLHLYCPETGGYSATGGQDKNAIIYQLLKFPIQRNADYKELSVKKFKKLYPEVMK